MNVALVTSETFPDLTDDDAQLASRLRAKGARVSPEVWTNPSVDWSSFDCAVIRSTWDYHLHPERFSRWIDRVAHATTLFNQPELLQWNLHKRYLLDLAETGVPIIPTVFIPRGAETPTLSEMCEKLQSRELVAKPAISASAYRTTVFADGFIPLAHAVHRIEDLAKSCDVLVQRFQREIFDPGERSLMFFGRTFSHAVRRPPLSTGAAGGERREMQINPRMHEIETAGFVLDRLPVTPIYARVDLLPLRSGEVALAELEVIEPALYFSFCSSSADAFAGVLLSKIGCK